MPILVNRNVVVGDVLKSIVNTYGNWKVVRIDNGDVYLRDDITGYECSYQQDYLRTFMYFVAEEK